MVYVLPKSVGVDWLNDWYCLGGTRRGGGNGLGTIMVVEYAQHTGQITSHEISRGECNVCFVPFP